MSNPTTLLNDVGEAEPSKRRKLSVTRSPDAVRAIVRQLIDDDERCTPEDLRARHDVEGGNRELSLLIGEVRNSLRAKKGESAPRIVDDPTSDLPVEFRPLEALVHRAALDFVSRVSAETHHHAELRIAAAQQDAATREAALRQELDSVYQEARASEEELGAARADAEQRAAALLQLEARLAEHVQHQGALAQSNEDLRASVHSADERMRGAIAENDLLRTRAEGADGARLKVEAEMELLRDSLCSQVEELRLAQAAVAARTQEATMLQRMLDAVVETNAALVACLEVPVSPLNASRTRRAPAKHKAPTALK